MTSLDEIINTSQDVREVKRALSVKMLQEGIVPQQIHRLLNVSVQYVSKWKTRYEAEGVDALLMAYKGKAGYLSPEQEHAIIEWIQSHKTLSVEQLIDHITCQYHVTYKSKQSYYNLLDVSGMSVHRSEKVNPKHDEVLVLEKRAEIKKNFWSMKKRFTKGKLLS